MARRRRKPARRDETRGWVYMLFGLTLGLGVAVVVYLTGANPHAPPHARPAPLEPPPKRAPAVPPARAVEAGKRPAAANAGGGIAKAAGKRKDAGTDFDFYEILPQSHVDVPAADGGQRATAGSTAPPASSGAPPAPVETPGRYYLQAGSFRSPDEADRMQANLALLGIESSIQKVRIDNDEYQRVRIGPIGDLDELNGIREKLHKAGVDALVMHAGE